MTIPNWTIFVAGGGQIFTALIYPFVRHKVFDWYNDVKKLKPLNQQVAKTYGYYIQGLNFGFGLIAFLLADDLKNQTPLAVALTGLIAAYWVGKIWTQFKYYPMYEIPDTFVIKTGEVIMNGLFIAFAGIFTLLFLYNLGLFGS